MKMENYRQKIIEKFASLCKIPTETAVSERIIIDSVINEVTAMLRDTVILSENEFLFTNLCSAFCACKYIELNLLNQPDSIHTLDITISKNNSKTFENAQKLKQDAIILAHHILKDEKFYFGRTN